MFKFFKPKRLNSLKKKSAVVSSEFIKEENDWCGIFDNSYVLTANFCVIGIDEREYSVEIMIDDMRSLNAKIYKNSNELRNINAYGRFDADNKNSFFLERIESRNPQYKGFGWGSILMECMVKTLKEYCDLNGYYLERIYGTIGVGGGDTPEKSMPLYLSFDNYPFDETLRLHLRKEGFNVQDRNLEYLIA